MRPGCFHPRNGDTDATNHIFEDASMRPGCFHPRNNEQRHERRADEKLQ